MLGGIRMSIAPLELTEPGREARAIAVPDQPGIERLADRRYGRHACTEIAPISVDAPTVATPSEPGIRPIKRQHPDDQPVGDTGGAHQFAGENEERDRQQRVILKPAEHDLMNGDRRHRQERHEGENRTGQQQHEDRRADRQQGQRDGAERPDHAAPPRLRDRRRISLTRIIAAMIAVPPNPTSSAECGISIGMPSAMLVCPVAVMRWIKPKDWMAA